MKRIILTGATRGLGLAFANHLARYSDVELTLAVRDLERGKAVARKLGPNVHVRHLDMASRASIQNFAANWDQPLFALINNAGLQNVAATAFSEDQTEITLAVNHLSPLELSMRLLPFLQGGKVLGIGSGTHNPNDAGARRFGFRGGLFSSINALARGDIEGHTDKQRGYNRYATSKLLSMTTGVELSKRLPETDFLCLDPGLMPGTGLARTAPPLIKALWTYVLPAAGLVMSGTSTPCKSAGTGTHLLMEADLSRSGEIYDHRGKLSEDVWDRVADPTFGKTVVDQSLDYLGLS